MKFPEHLPQLKEAPKGYEWVYRGTQWVNTKEAYIAFINIVGEDVWYYTEDKKRANGYNFHYAELVECECGVVLNTLEEQIAFAKSAVGKTFTYNNGKPFVIKDWDVSRNKGDSLHSVSVWSEIDKNGICVYLLGEDKTRTPVLNKHLKEYKKPEFLELKLNDSYTAKVYDGKVEVGCQTFPISILGELLNLHKQLKQ